MTDLYPISSKKRTIRSGLMLSSLCMALFSLSACEQKTGTSSDDSEAVSKAVVEENAAQTSEATDTYAASTHDMADIEDVQLESTRDKPLTINWQAIDSGVKPVDPDSFNYPFELDSASVQSQAKFSGISAEQARHSLTVGMASNEPMEKLLNQLGDSYLSHTYSEKDAQLIVYTTPNVTPSQFDYVIAHEFAHGLTLPIVITSEPPPKAQTEQSADHAVPESEAK